MTAAKGHLSRWRGIARYSSTRMLEDHRWLWIVRLGKRRRRFKADMVSESEWCARRHEGSGWHNGARVHI
jgi:hypothetical protein